MALQLRCWIVCLLLLVLLVSVALTNDTDASTDPPIHCGSLSRSSFEPGFIFGTASASYQFEGAAKEDGRGPSIWDTYTHDHPERIVDGSNGDVAVDQYHRYKEDVRIMKDMGLDAYRFSISWSRLLPSGKLSGGVNQRGIIHYNNLIDELLRNGIKPVVTLFHWDVPEALEHEYGGFLSPRIINHFRDYAELCYKEFGDRVKQWTTLNEPHSVSNNGFAVGSQAPGRCSYWQNRNCLGGDSAIEPYLATHHLLLAHAAAVKVYKDKYQAFQKGLIGITLNTYWFVPASETKEDKHAALRSLDFMFGWFMEPLTSGDYPQSMRSLVGNRLPVFTNEESMLLTGSFDFLGLNYYTARYSSNDVPDNSSLPASYVTDSHVKVTIELNGVPIGPPTASDWLYVYPKGVYDLLLYIKKKYNDPLIYITESGVSEFNDPKLSLQEALNDTNRVDYYYRHLCYVRAAIKNGSKVKGYIAWSLLDNFEWEIGYAVRFGINYVDYNNGLKRYPKLSADWFKSFLKKDSRSVAIRNVRNTKFVYQI
ncbi:hypothetical protein PS1_005594 [Malus domestica]